MKPRRDVRLQGLLFTVAAIGMVGGLITLWPDQQPQPATPAAAPQVSAENHATSQQHAMVARRREIDERFQQAVAMLHAKQYDYAVKALHRVLALSPQIPEAHVNMGYALLGLKDYAAARDFFQGAIELRQQQLNAYYGLAEALEGAGDLEGAVGAMRTYVHLSKQDDPFLTRARAALWEWQAQLEARRTATAAGPPG